VAWQIRSKTRSSLLEAYAAEKREGLLQQQIEFQKQVSKALEQQMQAGAIAGSELLPIRIAMIKSHLDLADAQRARAEARARIAEAIGVSVRALDQITLSFDSLERVGTVDELAGEDLRRAALQGRPDILGALAEYDAAQSALQLEIAKQYPDVHLQPGYQYDQGDNKWSLGIVVDLPVFHQNQGPIAEAKARRGEAAAKFEALQAKVLAEIETASQVLRVTRQTAATLRSLTEAQSERRESVASQFKAGATDQLELLNAQTEFVAAELVQLDGQIKLQQAVGAMEDAVQRPFDYPSAALASSRAHAH
jgi:outer membrane protein TolC